MADRVHHVRWLLGALAGAGTLALTGMLGVLAGPAGSTPARGAARRPPRGIELTIGRPTGRAIAPGFLGLSFEYFAIPSYAGTDPSAVNPVLVQLIRNLAGRSPPVLRIGGDTTDATWWPAPGLTQPAGVNYALSSGWVASTRRLAAELGARLILGVNLEADDPGVASVEANNLVNGVGRRRVAALELGNEPELYGIFTWGVSDAPGRPRGYDFPAFERDFETISRALPSVPLAAPAVGWPGWFRYVGPLLSDQPAVTATTLHRYPLQLCYVHPGEPNYPTIPHLLTAWSTHKLARSVAGAVAAAHARHIPLRIDEINTISCGSVPAVAQSFASALWGLDVLFEMAAVGVDGVNMHTFPGATYELFTIRQVRGRWQAVVAPEYYGLEAFAQAAPAGSRLLSVSPSPRRNTHLKVWALRAPDHTLRVVAINEGGRARTLAVRAGRLSATGTLARLEAPGRGARRGVTLAGQSFGATTTTGVPAGRRRTFPVAPAGGSYKFDVPAASAAVLSVPAG